MKITWEADDGYVGGSAPQYTKIADDDLFECSSIDDAMELIEEAIQSDFEQKIKWTCDMDKIRKEVESLFKESKGNP